MALRLSITEFGAPASVVTNALSVPQLDADWFVDFDRMGAQVDITFGAIAKADTFTIAPATLTLWASSSPTSIAGATVLAALPLAPSVAAFLGQSVSVTVNNPGGQKHLILTSTQGAG